LDKKLELKTMKTSFIALLCLSSFLVAPLPAQEKSEPKKPAVQNLKPEQFEALRKADTNSTVVLDVRTKKERQEGHIPGSVLLDFNSDNFEQELTKLDKNKTYLVHCAAGGRSARACKKMDQLGFKKVYNLEGGMGAWEKAKKPVQK
jgi:rhodanese-related sulfurtransferase